MSYLCTHKVNLGGTRFFPGDIIPEECVAPERIWALKSAKMIAEQPDGTPAQTDSFSEQIVPVPAGENAAIGMYLQEIADALTIMQMNAEKAVEAVKAVDRENVLILIHATDSRQSIKKAAKAQAEKLGF